MGIGLSLARHTGDSVVWYRYISTAPRATCPGAKKYIRKWPFSVYYNICKKKACRSNDILWPIYITYILGTLFICLPVYLCVRYNISHLKSQLHEMFTQWRIWIFEMLCPFYIRKRQYQWAFVDCFYISFLLLYFVSGDSFSFVVLRIFIGRSFRKRGSFNYHF